MSDRESSSGSAEERADLTGLNRLSDRPPPPRGERTIRVARGLSVLLLAIAAAGLPWYFVTRSGGKSGPARSPTPTRSASPSPSPSASGKPGTYEVYNIGTVCLRIRPQPSTANQQFDCLTAGVRVTSDGHVQVADGRLWRRVFDKFKKRWGWAADQYLKPVA